MSPRAVGIRKRYADTPSRVRTWVEETIGAPVVETYEQSGGMSPGCATRILCGDGTRAFVKAVGPELNPSTPDLFRHEARVLSHLGSGALWADILAVYDEPDGWVAVVLQDVPGRHPDLTDALDVPRVLDATDTLAEMLRGRASGLDIATSAEGFARWTEVWRALDDIPPGVLPDFVRERTSEFESRHRHLIAAAVGDSLVHADIRDDNMLVRGDGTVVFVDWGMARRGPSWVDPLIVRLEWVDLPVFDDLVSSSAALYDLGDDQVTTFLVTLGAWLGHRSTVADDTGLPTLNAFRRRESARMLAGAERRLDR